MAYPVSKGSSVSILHRVPDLAGTGVVTGQSANLTYTITDPAGTQTTTGITWTEPNSDGFYAGARTYSTIGNWHVAVSNAGITSSDQGVYDYTIQCIQDAAGATPSGTYLTTVANLKEMAGITNADEDDFLLNLIARSTQQIERFLGRSLVSASYTELQDGRGDRTLGLKHGPIQSVTYVADVTWSSVGVKSTTAISAGDYFARGTAAEGWHLPGYIERYGSAWNTGQRNYEVSYSAGYTSVPYDLENCCLEMCVWYRNQRRDHGLSTRNVGSGSMFFRGPQGFGGWTQNIRMLKMLEPYMDTRYA